MSFRTTLTLGEIAALVPFPKVADVVPSGRSITMQLLEAPQVAVAVPRKQTDIPAPSLSVGGMNVLLSLAAVIPNPPPAQAAAVGGELGRVTFDIVSPSDGWAQRIAYGFVSRQSESQTALGFHVMEWGVGIGTLDADILVSLGSDPPSAVQKFSDLIYTAKRTTPLADETPKRLRWIDSYLGKSLDITLRAVRLLESVDEPWLARLQLQAGIIGDASNAGAATPIPSTPASVADTALASLKTFAGKQIPLAPAPSGTV